MMNPYHRPHRRLLNTEVIQSGGAPPNHGGPQHGSHAKEANFDTNMVIILAALLCALICALGLNSIVRCALRCSRRLAFETEDEVAARGVKKRELRQIPVAVYGEGIGIPATDCPICLGEFMDGEKVRILPKCNHGFHVRCIDIWLASHSSCPTCRQSLIEPRSRNEDDANDGIRQPVNAYGGHDDVPGSADDVG